ncbi:MAG: SMP-30/gluconolactonase/LRE family protein [Mesorhizobium sp.]
MKIEVVVDVKTTLGEGPLWDVEQERLYWIDSFDGRVFRATADGREIRSWDVPMKISSMALRHHQPRRTGIPEPRFAGVKNKFSEELQSHSWFCRSIQRSAVQFMRISDPQAAASQRRAAILSQPPTP